MAKKVSLSARTKIWIEDEDGGVVFGIGRVRMLEAIKREGSLHAAAKSLKMGYKGLWSRIHATEERLGQQLLTKKKGGAKGGGSQLTPLAEDLIMRFRCLQKRILEETDAEFEKIINGDLFSDEVED